MPSKIIAFSLWENNPKYCEGAIRNAELALEIYPGWRCRFYLDRKTVPPTYAYRLNLPHVEIVDMPEGMEGWKGMLARFLPDDVDVMLSRDCDSRLSTREAVAVAEWLESPCLIHSIRDHPFHSLPLMGGMWGAKRHAIPDIQEQIARWNKEDRLQTDQEFLTSIIWPQHKHKVLAHDNWGRFRDGAKVVPFSSSRQNNDFIGAIIGPNEERLHPEHHDMVANHA